jgi:hypothetical protein
MKSMAKRARERGVNRKMTTVIKGARSSLDRIKVPIFEWFYSPRTTEIYRYDSGVFEAYSPKSCQEGLRPTNPTIFYNHHHLKVLPTDAVRAVVRQHQDHFELVKKYPPANIWREVTSAKEIEQTILN